MWTLLPFGYHEDRTPTQGYAGDACRRDGGARQGLAAGMTAAPAHEWFQVKGLIAARPTMHVRYRGHTGKHMLVLSFTGFDPLQTSTTFRWHPRKCVLWVTLPNVPIRIAKTSRDVS